MIAAPERAAELLRAAAPWRLAAALLERPTEAWRREIADLAAECPESELRDAAEAAKAAREGAYLAALGPGGAASPRQVAYVPMADPGRVLADLRAFYDAFGYRPGSEDPADHVAVEAGFIAYLGLKQAFAAARGDAEAEAIVGRGASEFLARHLSPLAHGLVERLGPSSPDQVAAAVRWLAERCPAPEARPSPAESCPDADDCPMDCPLGP